MLHRQQTKTDWGLATIGQLNKKGPLDGEVGLEFELEGTNLNLVAHEVNELIEGKAKVWKAKDDASLAAGGKEFVLSKPLDRHLAIEAVEELYYLLNKKCDLQLSRACSTHVHLNFSKMTVSQTYLFLTLKYVLEEALFKSIAPNRFYNNYCVPLVLSGSITEELLTATVNQRLGDFATKYKATNYNALLSYGSIENRMKGGTNAAKEAIEWFDVLLEIYDVAKNNERLMPDVFLQQFSGKGFELYIQEFLPKTWAFINKLPDLSKIINRGVFAAQDIAYALDWSPCISGAKPKKVRASDKAPPAFATYSWTNDYMHTVTIGPDVTTSLSWDA